MWINCSCGASHWGRRGASGLLLTDPERTGVVLQKRSRHVHQGGTWGVPGGAIDRGETATEAALREAREEAGIAASGVRVVQTILGTDHGDWTYTYVLAEAPRPAGSDLLPGGYWEADRTTWVDLADVGAMNLHPALAAVWPRLHDLLTHESPGEGGLRGSRGAIS